MTSAKTSFFIFDVELEYECPECGSQSYCDLEKWDVHTLLEGLLDVECAKCGAKLRLEVGND